MEGILSPGFHSKARINYDGNKVASGTYAYMDTSLTVVNGDSIRLFYRANAADDWKVIKYMTKFTASLRTGYIEIDTLKLGEYTFGNSTDTSSVAINEYSKNAVNVNVYPNPAKHKCTVEFKEELKQIHVLYIYDIEGRIMMNKEINTKTTLLDINELAKGAYFVKIERDNRTVYSQKLLID